MDLTPEIISGFSTTLLQKSFDSAVESPDCHYDWWKMCTSKHAKVAIAAPRRHAKSTAITLAYVLACLVFRNKSYCLIISDTVTQASQFLNDIKRELAENDRLRELFQIQGFEKDTEDDVVVVCNDGHKFRVSAKGAEQKMRGLKWNNKRPDLIVGDDLENDEIVLNAERRAKFQRWFYGAVLPSLAVNGVIRIVGTILHEDSLLNNLMPSEWDKHTLIEPLRISSKHPRPSWHSVKYRAHTDNFSHLLWPQRYNKEWFLQERQDFLDRGLSDVYSQEYLNEPIDESVAYFKKSDFVPQREDDKKKRLNHYITVDLAIDQKQTSDYSVFMVFGVDESKMIHVINVIRERLDGREIVDTIMALHGVYKPELIGIEEMQVSKSIGPFLREQMFKSESFPNVIPLKHGGKDKISRARSIQARCRAHAVKFDKSGDWYPAFEDELCKFPRGTKDDQVDAFAYAGMMLDSLIEAPTDKELEEEEYAHEYQSSGLSDGGRSSVTGY
jgi:predicted phage terminase large subunit-like protein